MSSFTFNRIIYDPSVKMQLRDATLLGMSRFINILLTDATDKSKISRDHYRILFDVNLAIYLLSFFANTPFQLRKIYFISFIWTQ